MIPVTTFKGASVAVFGLGLTGISAARALIAGGADVAVWDDGEAGLAKAREAGLPVVDLREADWSRFAALVLSPGVPLTHPKPHWTVERARAAGVDVIGDTELFSRERRASGTAAKLVGITGTNGKSTTTALTHHLLKAAGRNAALGGNIGTGVLDLPPFADDLHYVIEFSSYQIDLTPTLDVNAACLLNVSPDHLDRHGDIHHYASVKARIFARQQAGDTAVIGVDDEICANIAETLQTAAKIMQISAQKRRNDGVFYADGSLFEARGGDVVASVGIAGIGSLRGRHNGQNAAAAYALARGMGLTPEEIAAGMRTFPGLPHRMEQVGARGRVIFINDSKATNADAAGKALASFDDIYWIAGGRPKDGGLAGLEPFWPRIRRAYLIGEAEAEFAASLEGRVPYERCQTLENAVISAARDAEAGDAAAPVVLLSPACASFDQFPNFNVRGDTFRALVAALPGVEMKGAAS